MLEELEQPAEQPPSRLGILDIVAFAGFFLLTLVIVQVAFAFAIRQFGLSFQNSVVAAVVVQGIIDVIVVGFIFFLVRVLHGFSFREAIHWYPNYPFSRSMRITLGTALALPLMLASTLAPQAAQTPIEKLLSSARFLFVCAIFGFLVAPLFEEIIFRGFLFKVFSDLKGPRLAIPATAILFSSLHALQLWGNWAAVVLIFAVGYILAVIRARSNSLIPGLIVHTAYNSALFGMYAISTVFSKWIKP